MSSATVIRLPERSEVKESDTWDLTKLFANDEVWDEAFNQFEAMIPEYEKFKGTLGNSAAELAACLGVRQQRRTAWRTHGQLRLFENG